jgi:hypothetical protein
MWDEFVKAATVEVAVGIAAALVGFFARHIVWVVTGLMADIPKVSGSWSTTSEEPQDKAGRRAPSKEEVELKQAGRYIWGTIRGSRGREWKLSGHLVGQTLFASFEYRSRKQAGGAGSLTLLVRPRGNEMAGWQCWHDLDTNEIEGARYVWRRNGEVDAEAA